MNFRYSILTITHTQTHAHSRTHTRARTTRKCTCHHRKKSTDKPINKLVNKTLSLLFWACPSIRLSVRCRGHSNLVIFNRIFSKYHIIINLSFKFEYSFLFCQTISKKAAKMAATSGLNNLVIIIGFLPNLYMDCFHQTLVQYVLKNVILWKQRMHQRTETRVCKFSGPY